MEILFLNYYCKLKLYDELSIILKYFLYLNNIRINLYSLLYIFG